jgi:hypothetical protein
VATQPSRLDTLLVAICDGLALRAGLAGVQIGSGPLGDSTERESIQFVGGNLAQEWGSIGKLEREESIELAGSVWVRKEGGGETVIREARARAFVLLAELEDFLRADPSVGTAIRVGALARGVLDQGAGDGYRWVELEFLIQAGKRLQSS